MTIEKGQPWGNVGPAPAARVHAGDDSGLRDLVIACRSSGQPIPPVVLTAGDLFRSVGGTAGVDRVATGDDVATLPVDVVRLVLDGGQATYAVAHVILRRPFLGSSRLGWWRGPLVAVMNAEHRASWDVAPRGHPNDGRVDIVTVDASMPPRARLQALRRVRLGSHLPHPFISTRQVRSMDWTFERPVHVFADGVHVGEATRLEVTVEPDALDVVV